ncbi:hypothetical protein [uncultured Traorella sp.]|uniref:hypothetical protein n=1 Tax=uncultured Traorella sp. TaxID=1929048 RepID=UPI0025E67EB7|nr:hypothetical protein [uncultured Traorella sp.]
MSYTKKEKYRFGKLFKYYRIRENVSVKDIEFFDRASYTTYRQAENGGMIRKDDFYDEFIQFYHKEFKRIENFDEWLNSYIPKAARAFEYFDEDYFAPLYKEMKEKLSDYKNCILYGEYYYLFKVLFQYYMENHYLNKDEIDDLLELMKLDIFEHDLLACMVECLYTSNFNYVYDQQYGKKIIDATCFLRDEPLVRFYEATERESQCYFIQSMKMYEDLYDRWKEESNHYRMAKCVNALYTLGCNIDDAFAEEKLIQLKEMIDTCKLPKNFMLNVSYNIAMADMWAENYQEAFQRFMMIMEQRKDEASLFFSCYCCDRMDHAYPLKLLESNPDNEYMKDLLEYYRMKANDYDEEQLVRHIMKVILPKKLIQMKHMHPLWVIFDYELFNIANKKTKYKKYYLNYHEKMTKNCKDA